jgi:hypothetical protein
MQIEQIVKDLEERNLPTWQEGILYKALEFDFIQIEQLDEAVNILLNYTGEDDFFYNCCDANGLAYTLALASQI